MMKKLYLIIGLLLVACQSSRVSPTVWPTAVLPSAIEEDVLDADVVTDTAVSIYTISADERTPPELLTAVQTFAQARPEQYRWVEGDADILLTPDGERPFAQWVYVAAAPFATVEDGISFAEIGSLWKTAVTDAPRLFVSEQDVAPLAYFWGEPAENVAVVSVVELADRAWEQRPSRLILPFEQLTPDLKVLTVEGISPVQKSFDLAQYPLLLPIGVTGEDTAVSQFIAVWDGPVSNYDPTKITTVAVTGVTALVRATAYNMEQFGILWPSEEVAAVLQNADIAHLSNEVSFDPDCPYPDPIGGTSFCSDDAYFALIESLGIDVVELTGNHLNDYGRSNVNHSMEMYEQAGMQTFGGGRTLAEAAQPALFEQNGNKIAFVGCNPVGPTYAWATETEGGSRPCTGALPSEIAALNADGYVVITTLQYLEVYQYAPTAQQEVDFRVLLDAGATAVSGSQGHHVQGFALYKGGFIHYGVGNLFFDQMEQLGTRQMFIDLYTIYDGRLLNVDLWTGLIENYARPRTMTPAERKQLLETLFQVSGWGVDD